MDLITGLRAYLDRAYADPVLPLGASEVAERIGVARSTFYEHRESAAVAPLIAELDELRQRRAAMFREAEAVAKQAAEQEPAANGRRDDSIRATPKVGGSTSERGTELPQHQVAEQYGRLKTQMTWAVQRFLGQSRKLGHASDLPRAAYDLERLLGELHRVKQEMTILRDEWLRHASASPPPSSQESLPFD